ncbi:hypothetical protein ALT785_440014 [Alteromonas infernus]
MRFTAFSGPLGAVVHALRTKQRVNKIENKRIIKAEYLFKNKTHLVVPLWEHSFTNTFNHFGFFVQCRSDVASTDFNDFTRPRY